ncbi:RNA polymerase II transcriptional coactivator KIWI-like [Carica papaya]|uniref:RNA polymerase II transcriptional coactivator KIWI-like n=1 Tax=Carica papaya TaxID=3649 RepID=UPI000B8CB547|nr:RNA polymerase II transcriptional coactivator KIWI-like [Carica papaya]
MRVTRAMALCCGLFSEATEVLVALEGRENRQRFLIPGKLSERSVEKMSWRGKRKDEEDRSSGAKSDVHQPPKKYSKVSSSDDSDGIVVCELSKNRRVSVRNWQGKTWVDIREFYVKDGKQLPGKKGISLNIDQWRVLVNHVEEIDEELGED